MYRIGLVSDTHGLLRPQVLEALAGCRELLHGGDIGGPQILDALQQLAPVTAVRGNNDQQPWAQAIPDTVQREVDGIRILMVHDLKTLSIDPTEQRIDVVVAGHSHKPSIVERDGVLHVNPGSAGPRRFRLPVSVGVLVIDRGEVQAELIELAV